MRNGTIDFFRFIFSICIVLCHSSIFQQIWNIDGAIGVEFFFIVSGFLLCKKMYNYNKITNFDYRKFIIHKIGSIYIPYVLSLWMAFAITQLLLAKSYTAIYEGFWVYFGNSLGLGGILGFPADVATNVNWWLITMFMGSMLLVPIIIFNKEFYLYIFCPIVSLIIYGYMCNTYGSILVVMDKVFQSDFIYAGWLRAIAGICMGGISYILYLYFHQRKFDEKANILLIVEMFGYLFVIYLALFGYITGKMPYLGFISIIFLGLSISISFSEKSRIFLILQRNICFTGGAIESEYLYESCICSRVSGKVFFRLWCSSKVWYLFYTCMFIFYCQLLCK